MGAHTKKLSEQKIHEVLAKKKKKKNSKVLIFALEKNGNF